MKIKTFKGGYDSNFSYLLVDSDQALLIDATIPTKLILEYCNSHNLSLTAVVVMHSHHDHVLGLSEYKKLGIPIIAHSSVPFAVDKLVDETDTIFLGRNTLSVMHTPGHRFDCICLYDSSSKSLFTSDTLFVGGCGRVDFEGSDPEAMLQTLNRLKHLPGDTTIYPGHDYGPTKTSTIEIEKNQNIFFNMTKEEFLKNRLGWMMC